MSIPSHSLFRVTQALFTAFTLVATAGAQSLLSPSPVPLESAAAFKDPAANWQIAAAVSGDPRTEKTIAAVAGTGVLINNPTKEIKGNLFTMTEHGDAEIDLDFLLTPGSNSGVYVMGRYEVQLFDSWGAKTPTSSDCGGIYQRWDETRAEGKKGYEGTAPRANASRAPGLWQHLRIEFRAPRFDAAGKKTANARFVKVVLNDFVIHENVDVTGPTRGAPFPEEGPAGPIMIQGDHGPVAIRALAIKKFNPTAPQVRTEELAYKLYPLDPDQKEKYDSVPPKSQGKPAAFSSEAVEKNGKFAIVFTGSFIVPSEGSYSFTTGSYESVGLTIDNQPAILAFGGGGQSVALKLKAGRHPFHLEYVHSSSWAKPYFNLMVEGPGLAPHPLTAPPEKPARDAKKAGEKPHTILIEPTVDRVRMQRSFVPFDPKKRLYAVNVGTPNGIHYAYDFETAAILRVWRGGFLDAFELWDGRAENQLAIPTGPALTLLDKPVLALLERYTNDWPDQPDAMWSSQGYTLEPDGQPTFRFKLSSLSATDRIAPSADGHGFTRTLMVKGDTTSWGSWILLAEAGQITPQAGNHSYIVGDRSYYLDLPADSSIQPILRTRNGKQQLLVPINGNTLGKSIVYSLVW